MHKSVTLPIVASVAAVSAMVVLLPRGDLAEDGHSTVPSSDVADSTMEALAVHTVDPEGVDRAAETPAIDDGADNAAGFDVSGHITPAAMENAIYQRIAEQPGIELMSLTSVNCDTLRCRIAFIGVANAQYGDLLQALIDPPWNNYRATQSSRGSREVAPGVREYIMEFTYVALVDASDDPRLAARQHAACSGAWTRVTQLHGSNEYIRQAHEQAAKHLALAAGTLGLEDAKRLADSVQFGPLSRDCGAHPY